MHSISKVPFQEQLDTFQKLGFELNPGVTIADIDRWGGPEEFENDPYYLMYITLGQTIEREPWTPLTNRCWDFDTEAISDHGDYVKIIKNLDRITRGELTFEHIKDYVDLEQRKAWVSFTINGDYYQWDLDVNDDWVDHGLFSNVVDLTMKYKTKGKYTYFSSGGQMMVVGYETPGSLKKLQEATQLKIVWMN